MGPTGAGVDWHGFELGAARKGAIVCSGGTLYPGTDRPSYVTLPYGKTWRQKMFSCSLRVNGVNCSNPNGHGFFLSRVDPSSACSPHRDRRATHAVAFDLPDLRRHAAVPRRDRIAALEALG
jgi:hypothetical protein